MLNRRNRQQHNGGAPLWMLDLMFLTAGALAWLLFYFILRARLESDPYVAPQLLTSNLPTAYVGEKYHVELAKKGTCDRVTWQMESGPDWLELDKTSGVLSGTPPELSAGQKSAPFEVAIRISSECPLPGHKTIGSSKSVRGEIRRREIEPPPLRIATDSLPPVMAGENYTVRLAALGGYPFRDRSEAYYKWSVTQGKDQLTKLGLFLDEQTGELHGRVEPTLLRNNELNIPVKFGVLDEANTFRESQMLLVVKVVVPKRDLRIVMPSEDGRLPESIAGRPFCLALSAIGGAPPYTWTILEGEYEQCGLQFDASTGILKAERLKLRGSGAEDLLTLKVGVTDTQKHKAEPVTLKLPIKLTQEGKPLELVTKEFPIGIRGQPYQLALSARYGSGRHIWTVTNLPQGLSCDSNGIIQGVPDVSGRFSLLLKVEDQAGGEARARALLDVQELTKVEPLEILTGKEDHKLPSAVIGESYNLVLAAKGGRGERIWSLLAVHPSDAGLTVTEDGRLTAKRVENAHGAKELSIAVRVQDEDGRTATADLILPLTELGVPPKPLKIITETLPKAVAGDKFVVQLSAAGYAGSPRWKLKDLQCNDEISQYVTLSETGLLEINIPEWEPGRAPERIRFTAEVSDDHSASSDSKALEVVVVGGKVKVPKLAIRENPIALAVVGEPFVYDIPTTGGVDPKIYEIQGVLPPGLAFDEESGRIYGIPKEETSSECRVLVTDMQGDSVTADLRLRVLVAGTGGVPVFWWMEVLAGFGLLIVGLLLVGLPMQLIRTARLPPTSPFPDTRPVAIGLLVLLAVLASTGWAIMHFWLTPYYGKTWWYGYLVIGTLLPGVIALLIAIDNIWTLWKGYVSAIVRH